jgi:hypothetical protein
LLAVAGLVVFLVYPSDVDRKLSDLKNGTPEARRQAIVWFSGADLDASHAPVVAAALEPLLFEGDVRGDLSTDLVLRAYLHWAGPDNVPTLIRLVQGPLLPNEESRNTALVVQALGKLQDPRAAYVLAEKLADPALSAAAVDALRLMGPRAETAVLRQAFDGASAARLQANHLLAEYGTRATKIAGEALARLKSNNPDARRSGAVWFAENPPTDEKRQAEVATVLTRLLDDLSPRVNALALDALKLWATRDSVPSLVAFARRNEKAGPCPSALIDVLARFPDETTAEAIALQLKVPANRGRAVQALLKFGLVASKAVLLHIDDPDAAIQKETRGLAQQLNVPLSLQLNQALADLADAQKPRVRAALQYLPQLRPDEASRTRVSQALNASLLDPDPAVLADALGAVRVWGSKANTASLLKLLGTLRTRGGARDPRIIDLLGVLQDSTAAPALAEGLTRPEELEPVVKALVALGSGAEEAVLPYVKSTSRGARFAASWVLGEIGTARSLSPLRDAGSRYVGDDPFNRQLLIAAEKITARK